MTGETRWDNAVDLAGNIIAPTDLDLDITWSDKTRLVILVGWCQGNGKLAIRLRIDGQPCVARQIERVRQSTKDAVSLTDA